MVPTPSKFGSFNEEGWTNSKKTFLSRLENLVIDNDIEVKKLESQLRKMKETDPKNLNEVERSALLNNIHELESQLASKENHLKSIQLFAAEITKEVEIFSNALKEVSDTQGSVDALNSFQRALNNVMACLVKFDAFRKNELGNEIKGGVVLWSKINQRYAGLLAQADNKTTLEGSLAGSLFDGISWGIGWSTNPENLLKQFWMKMSIEIANTADQDVELHAFGQVVRESAFYTDEWPRIEAKIKEDEGFKGLYLTKHLLVEEIAKDNDIYLLENPLTEDELKEAKYNNCYIFSKVPPSLIYISNGIAESLVITDSYPNQFQNAIKKMKSSNQPLDKGDDLSKKGGPLIREYSFSTVLRSFINKNPGHQVSKGLNVIRGKKVSVLDQHELEAHILEQDNLFKSVQQVWQDFQTKEGKEDEAAKVQRRKESTLNASQTLSPDNNPESKDAHSPLTPPPTRDINVNQLTKSPKVRRTLDEQQKMSQRSENWLRRSLGSTSPIPARRKTAEATPMSTREIQDFLKSQQKVAPGEEEKQFMFRTEMLKIALREGIRLANEKRESAGDKDIVDQAQQLRKKFTDEAEEIISEHQLGLNLDKQYGGTKIRTRELISSQHMNANFAKIIGDTFLCQLAINTSFLNAEIRNCLMRHIDQLDDISILTDNTAWIKSVNDAIENAKSKDELGLKLAEKFSELNIRLDENEIRSLVDTISNDKTQKSHVDIDNEVAKLQLFYNEIEKEREALLRELKSQPAIQLIVLVALPIMNI